MSAQARGPDAAREVSLVVTASRPIAGTVRAAGDEHGRSFNGWLDLFSQLHELLDGRAPTPRRASPNAGPAAEP